MIDYNRLAIDTAKLSPCAKRKVGAVAVGPDGYVTSFNYNPNGDACELPDGTTASSTIHAEVAAIQEYELKFSDVPDKLYVTQPPCAKCTKYLQDKGVININVVEEFMKFDSAKLRYELIPPSTTFALARVLTYGARKYKPNNWKKGKAERYVGAAMRHLEAWRNGEKLDEESGLPHLEHLLTNVAFLVELDEHAKSTLDALNG